MKKFLSITLLLIFSVSVQQAMAQTDSSKNDVYTVVEVMPEFPGGQHGLAQFLQKNMVYPKQAKKHNISGKVLIKFVVDSMGNVGDVQVVRGIGYGCDEEAVRVVKMMPRWKPGKQDGKPVNVYFMLPIQFSLQ